jgi:hypothetical protein
LAGGELKSNFEEASDERRQAVGEVIQWESDLSRALERAKAENKPVLMDFFNPG